MAHRVLILLFSYVLSVLLINKIDMGELSGGEAI